MTPGGTDHDANHLTVCPPCQISSQCQARLRASDFPSRGLFAFRVLAQGPQSLCVSRTQTCINLVHKSQRTNQMPVWSSVARTLPSSGLEGTFYPEAPFPRSWQGEEQQSQVQGIRSQAASVQILALPFNLSSLSFNFLIYKFGVITDYCKDVVSYYT